MMRLKIKFMFLLLVVVAGTLFSCGKTNQYTISGELPGRYDGCRVFITPATFYFSPGKPLPLDSAMVRRGRFSFQGIACEQPAVYILTIEGMNDGVLRRAASCPVIIERGNIRVVYDSLGTTVSGTPLNERYMELIGEGERAMIREQQLLLAKKR